MTLHIHGLASLFLVTSTALAGCGLFGTAQPEPERWTGNVRDLRVQWDAEPGIDVLTGVAVPVRAYLESRDLARYTGNLDNAYPGFTRAVPPNEPPESPDLAAMDRIPTLEYPADSPRIGNSRFHFLSVMHSGRDVTVTVCNYTYGVAQEQSNDSFVSLDYSGPVDKRGIIGMRVLLVAPDNPVPLPPQQGPEPAPMHDVFGEWKISGFLVAIGSSVKAQWDYGADYEACVENAPDPPDRRAFLTNGEHPRSIFPTSPASPGWPAQTGT